MARCAGSSASNPCPRIISTNPKGRSNPALSSCCCLRVGTATQGFLRLRCPDCGDEHLLAFTCNGRHFCPSCHQRRVRQTAAWIATSVCHEVPYRQFVFTIPRVLRGILGKRRDLLHLLAADVLTNHPARSPCPGAPPPAVVSSAAGGSLDRRHRLPGFLGRFGGGGRFGWLSGRLEARLPRRPGWPSSEMRCERKTRAHSLSRVPPPSRAVRAGPTVRPYQRNGRTQPRSLCSWSRAFQSRDGCCSFPKNLLGKAVWKVIVGAVGLSREFSNHLWSLPQLHRPFCLPLFRFRPILPAFACAPVPNAISHQPQLLRLAARDGKCAASARSPVLH